MRDEMTSSELNCKMEITEKKQPRDTEVEIRKSTDTMKNIDPGKVKLEVRAVETNSSEGSPGEKSEIEEGATEVTKTEPGYPTGIRFVLLTISLMLGVYTVALDTTIISEFQDLSAHKEPALTSVSNCHPKHHNSLPLHPRHRLVQRRLPPPHNVTATELRQNLHLLPNQNHLRLRAPLLRSRFPDLCSHSFITNLYSWSSGGWCWSCGDFWRRNDTDSVGCSIE